jgi:hypothetical protein
MHNYGKDPDLVHLVSEIPFAVWISGTCGSQGPFCTCSSTSPFRCFWLVGRFDGVVQFMGELYVLENKTTRSMSASYLRGLEISRQPSTYTFAVRQILKQNGFDALKLRGVLFNVVAFGEAITKFHRFPVLRSEKYLTEYEDETRRIVADIRGAFSNSTVKPLKRTTECTTYGVCPFISLCDAWQGNPREKVPQIISNYPLRTWRPF